MNNIPKGALNETPKKRVLNEIEAKVNNEGHSDEVTTQIEAGKRADHTDMVFGCECDTKDCPENIVLSTEEYAQAHSKSMHFIVIPSHVRLDIEDVVASFKLYSIVKKHFPTLAAA